MTSITAKEWELLGCFASEPQRSDRRLPWLYDDSVYTAEIGALSVSCAIQPSYRDVRLTVRLCGERIYELNAANVADVRVLDEPGKDILEIQLSDWESLRVQLRPSFEITHGFERHP
jgi:hypothetical protein